jgi:hypothetical protein
MLRAIQGALSAVRTPYDQKTGLLAGERIDDD